tara:strand:+ start:1348 stop:1899 length:552 start_codon:yes stop_codon:yes gene_type:complete
MFGHNALNYANFGSLVFGAELKKFRASTEVSKDDTSNYYVIKPVTSLYVSYFSKSGEKIGSNYGTGIASQPMIEKVNSAIASLPDGSTYILEGFFPDEGVENSPDTASPSNADTDPNDCAGENRVKGTDDVCGSCLSGYTEDDTGMCVADEDPADDTEDTNWLLYGGLGAVALVAVFFMKGKS